MTGEEIYRPRRAPRSRRLKLRGVDYHVSEWGEPGDRTLVYLHGWGDTGSAFQFVVDELPDHYHVIAPDWRGFGESGRNPGPYWFPDYLADLDELVDQIGIPSPFNLVGHSMGANVAGLYAGAMPERVATFVNVEGFGLPDSDVAEAPARYREWLSRQRTPETFREFSDFDALADHIRRKSPGLSKDRARFVARLWAREVEAAVVICADPRHKLPNPTLYRRAEAEACWRAIEARTLLVIGDESKIARMLASDKVPPLTRLIDGASELRIKGAGHMLHFEAARALASAIDAFLDA